MPPLLSGSYSDDGAASAYSGQHVSGKSSASSTAGSVTPVRRSSSKRYDHLSVQRTLSTFAPTTSVDALASFMPAARSSRRSPDADS
eukprot:2022414-Prymnesium_polylepis.1